MISEDGHLQLVKNLPMNLNNGYHIKCCVKFKRAKSLKYVRSYISTAKRLIIGGGFTCHSRCDR